MAQKTILFDGQKNLSLTDAAMWRDVLGWEVGASSSIIGVDKAYSAVGYVNRCVDIRANAVSSLPWSVSRNDDTVADNEDNSAYPWLGNLADLLYLTEASLCLEAKAFWYQVRNRRKDPHMLRWFAPTTTKPKWDASAGLIGFERKIGAQAMMLPVEDVLYFRQPNPLHETEPGPSPVASALSDINVVFNLNQFAAKFFERGAIRATVLTVEGGIPAESDREKLKSAWARALQGIKNAFGVEVFNSSVKPVAIGDGVGDLDNTDLTNEKREAISTALGVPHTLVMSNAANYATAEADRLSLYDLTVVPSSRRIADVLNRGLFGPMGLHFRFEPQSLPIYQEDEEQRAQSLLNLVNAGIPLHIAVEMLGMTLPEGYEYSDLEVRPEPQPQPEPQPVVVAATPQDETPAQERAKAWEKEAGQLRKWIAVRRDRGQRVQIDRFDAKHLSEAEKAGIYAEVAEDGDADDAPFPVADWSAYP